MKRFLLFTMTDYDEGGGLNDLEDSFDTEEEALAGARTALEEDFSIDRIQIFDCEKREKVYDERCPV